VRVNPRRVNLPGAIVNGHCKTTADARDDDLPWAAADVDFVSQVTKLRFKPWCEDATWTSVSAS
jgi:hypothetical protein